MTTFIFNNLLSPLNQAPHQLDGSRGQNRVLGRLCQINASNDMEAINTWLNRYQNKSTTYRAYQKEAERLVLYSLIQLKKAFSDLNKEDLEKYFLFLQNPEPKQLWCAPSRGRNGKRGTSDWKPFLGPLSASAQATAKTILNSLFDYLVKASYLSFNPISLIKIQSQRPFSKDERKIKIMNRMLQPDEWSAIKETLSELPEETSHEKDDKARLIFIVSTLFLTGLRVSELVNTTWQQFVKIEDQWWLAVKGKGDREGLIPVNDSLLSAITNFRRHLGLVDEPQSSESSPIIPSWRRSHGVSANYIGKLLKSLSQKAAKKFKDNPLKQEKLNLFSPHWLRHLSASMQDNVGIKPNHIKENLRHSNIETTQIYMHSLDKARHQDMQKLELNLNKKGG